jgi:hypothetical protein
MLHRAVIKGILRPCVLILTELQPLAMMEDGKFIRDDSADRRAHGWRYTMHKYQIQTEAFEASYYVVGDMSAPAEGCQYWDLGKPLTLSDILLHGVVMYADLIEAEKDIRTDGYSTKEENSQLRVISALAGMYCRFDPAKRDGLAQQISTYTKENGIYISDGTARRWLRKAMQEYPPTYLAKGLDAGEFAAPPASSATAET